MAYNRVVAIFFLFGSIFTLTYPISSRPIDRVQIFLYSSTASLETKSKQIFFKKKLSVVVSLYYKLLYYLAWISMRRHANTKSYCTFFFFFVLSTFMFYNMIIWLCSRVLYCYNTDITWYIIIILYYRTI